MSTFKILSVVEDVKGFVLYIHFLFLKLLYIRSLLLKNLPACVYCWQMEMQIWGKFKSIHNYSL